MRGLLLGILLLSMGLVNAESRYALLLANQNYPTAQKDLNIFGELETPVQEMREFAKVLRDYNFEVTEIADANLDSMSVAINRFTSKLQPGDVGLFYYAGHGVQVEGNNYLIPVNKKFADAVEVKNGAYLAQNAIDKLSGSSARVKLVFLDSCRNQLLMKEKHRGFGDPGFAKMDATGIVISYATGLGKIAADNITYTSQLIKAIQSRANQPIEVVLSEAQELTAEATGAQQIPWYEKGMVGKFCFGTCGKPEPVKPEPIKEDNSAELEQLRKENERLRNANMLPPEKVTPPPTKVVVPVPAAPPAPEFYGYLRNNETKFVKFVKNNMGKNVNLTLSFEDEPYDYKGGDGLGLWYTSDTGFFFHCVGSWTNHTGYAEKGTISGIWKISDVKKLGGQKHYTLICV